VAGAAGRDGNANPVGRTAATGPAAMAGGATVAEAANAQGESCGAECSSGASPLPARRITIDDCASP